MIEESDLVVAGVAVALPGLVEVADRDAAPGAEPRLVGHPRGG